MTQQQIADWVAARTGGSFSHGFSAMCAIENGRIIAGLVFHN
jgi:hypothetical protein